MISSFTGFRGHAALFEIGGVKFVVLAKSRLALQQLHSHLLPEALDPFNPDACQKSVLIPADVLPQPTEKKI